MSEYCFKLSVDLNAIGAGGRFLPVRVAEVPPGIRDYLAHSGQFFTDGAPIGGSDLTYKPIDAGDVYGEMEFVQGSVTSGRYVQLGTERYSYTVEFEALLAMSALGTADIFLKVTTDRDANLVAAGFGPARIDLTLTGGGLRCTPWLSLQGSTTAESLLPGTPIVSAIYIAYSAPPYEEFWQNLVNTREVP